MNELLSLPEALKSVLLGHSNGEKDGLERDFLREVPDGKHYGKGI
ncbi:MAG: hypothetical protein ACOYJW_04780 [Candidatus Omnitrophota bacterium]|jgi:hypothetical protein